MTPPTRFTSCALLILLALAVTACVEPDSELLDPPGGVMIGETPDADNDADNDANADTPDADPAADSDQDAAPDAAPSGTNPLGCQGEQLTAQLYFDADRSSRSRFSQSINAGDTPLEGRPVTLLGPGRARFTTMSCAQGQVGLSGLEDGAYVLHAEPEQGWITTSSSQGARFGQAVAEGQLNVLVFGDSIPAFGPAPWYPARFTTLVEEISQVTIANNAIPGTQSSDWLPKTRNFETWIQFQASNADVIVFSVGGNDLYTFTERPIDPNNVGQALADFDVLLAQIQQNIRQIVSAIRVINPRADIVWMLYPNYATSRRWAALAPDLISTIETLLARKLAEIRRNLAHHEGLILWDIYGATRDLTLDDYLFDELHLNTAGHTLWARDLFITLGGVIIEGGASLDQERLIGFGEPPPPTTP